MDKQGDYIVDSILKHKGATGILDLSDDKSILEAYTLIAQHNGIQSVPIYRLEPQDDTRLFSKSYYGMLTAKDLVKFVISRHLIDPAQMIEKMLISELALQIKLRDCRIVGGDTSIRELVNAFDKDPVGVLVRGEGSFSFLAPVDLMRFVSEKGLFHDFEIESSPITERSMILRSDETALVAFNRLVSSPHNSLGIIDSSTNYLISNISISDFYSKNLTLKETLSMFNRLVVEFLNVTHPGIKRNMEAYVAHRGIKGQAGLKKLLGYHVHQLWLVDSDNKPHGLITFKDILKGIK